MVNYGLSGDGASVVCHGLGLRPKSWLNSASNFLVAVSIADGGIALGPRFEGESCGSAYAGTRAIICDGFCTTQASQFSFCSRMLAARRDRRCMKYRICLEI